MAIKFKEGIYPPVTLCIDYTGCIHMWEGSHNPINKGLLPVVNGREADNFIQLHVDKEAIMHYLTEDERINILSGYAIITQHIPDDYFLIN